MQLPNRSRYNQAKLTKCYTKRANCNRRNNRVTRFGNFRKFRAANCLPKAAQTVNFRLF